MILQLIVPLPPPGLPRMSTLHSSSATAPWRAWVDMKERRAVAVRRKPTEVVRRSPRSILCFGTARESLSKSHCCRCRGVGRCNPVHWLLGCSSTSALNVLDTDKCSAKSSTKECSSRSESFRVLRRVALAMGMIDDWRRHLYDTHLSRANGVALFGTTVRRDE